MRENDLLFHRHFLHDKFLVNNESCCRSDGHVVEKIEIDDWAIIMYRRFLYHVEGDFAHNVGQWIILSYAIVYDETIGCCICRHILLAINSIRMYTVALLSFVASNQWSQKVLSRQMREIQSNRFHNIFYEYARTYQIEQRISFCQNPDLNRIKRWI